MVTLKDVAKLAEVDIGSVSRTLSSHPRAQQLRPETRDRIFEAARKLGYHKNQSAAAMRTGRSNTVAIIKSGQENIATGLSSTQELSGILDGASQNDYSLKTYTDNNLPAVMDDILSSQIRHVISLSAANAKREETAALCRQLGLNLVFTYETAHGEFPAVTADNFNISVETVRYLASMGHRRIALVCGEYQFWHYMTEKYNGYLEGLKQSGIVPQFPWMICQDDVTDALKEMLARPAAERPTAFFCIGDGFAMQVQRQALKYGLKIPEEVSVTGFGNTDGAVDAYVPITTVDERHTVIGRNAFELLINHQVDDDIICDPDGTYRVPGILKKKDSVYYLNK